MSRIYNIGILAHVDAGKTTITENLLFLAGAMRQKGDVNNGSTVTDSLEIEKERGISVRSAAVSIQWKGHKINLIDTPGHPDFSAEVERVLRVLDGVVLVVSAVEGLQAHTFTLWEACQDMAIPVLIFVNKVDRAGADYEGVLNAIKNDFKTQPFPLFGVENEGLNDADISPLWETETPVINAGNEKIKAAAVELIADFDENILEHYLEGITIADSTFLSVAKQLNLDRFEKKNRWGLTPVFAGIAKKAIGMEALLNGVVDWLPAAEQETKEALSALVFKIEHHKTDGRIAHIRLFSGVLKSKDNVFNYSQQKAAKIGLVQKVFTNKNEIIGVLHPGDIGIITGLKNVSAGDILGEPGPIKPASLLHVPLITTQVKAVEDKDYNALVKALQLINSEDPALDFKWYKAEKELHLRMMGPMQIEILEAILASRFKLKATFGSPDIIYKETPSKAAEGFVRYWMPKPCWAIMKLRIEPGERGSGVCFSSIVRQSDVHKKYQNEVEKTIPKALEQGMKGWEVTDVKITMIEGEDHELHSRPGDFVLATPMAVMRGLKNAGTSLLEPMLDFEMKAPELTLGRIAGELTQMRAQFANPKFEDGLFILKGTVPAATSMNYSIQLSSTTGGKGRIRFSFAGYAVCEEKEGKTRPFKGVNPLDESQWILHRRGAFKAEERWM